MPQYQSCRLRMRVKRWDGTMLAGLLESFDLRVSLIVVIRIPPTKAISAIALESDRSAVRCPRPRSLSAKPASL
jgi:hypothetical protein